MNAFNAESDFALLDRFENGDDNAFTEIVHRYAGLVYSVCKRVVGDRNLAEDVAQETFFRLVARHDRIDSSLPGWLHRAASRLAMDALRSESARKRRETHVAVKNDCAIANDTPGEQHREVRWADVSPVIDQALADLPEAARTLLIQHFLQGVSQLDLAEVHGVSPATTCRRIRAALTELRQALTERGVPMAPAALPAALFFAARSASTPPASMMTALGKMAIAHLVGGTLRLGPIVSAPQSRAENPGWSSAKSKGSVATTRTGVSLPTILAAVALGLLCALPSVWVQLAIKSAAVTEGANASYEDRPVNGAAGVQLVRESNAMSQR